LTISVSSRPGTSDGAVSGNLEKNAVTCNRNSQDQPSGNPMVAGSSPMPVYRYEPLRTVRRDGIATAQGGRAWRAVTVGKVLAS
jgi:hypothetical protein